MTTIHLEYNNLPMCLSPAGVFVRAAAGRSGQVLDAAALQLAHSLHDTTCEFCKITLALWIQDEAASYLLQALTTQEQDNLRRLRDLIQSCHPDSTEYKKIEQQFVVAMNQLEHVASRWVAWMRSNPIIG